MSGSFENGDKVPLKGGEPVTPAGSVPNPEKLPDGQHVDHWILSDEERAKGFVRPVRRSYRHVGIRPKYPTRELTEEEKRDGAPFGYVLFEQYPESEAPVTGRMWTKAKLGSGCGTVTTAPQKIAETWAAKPDFYGTTFCCGCGAYLPVEEFVWDGSDARLGT
jgi:hypothetical protein